NQASKSGVESSTVSTTSAGNDLNTDVGDADAMVQEEAQLDANASQSVVDYWTPVISELKSFGNQAGSSGETALWIIFLAGLAGGFLALFTPCVWPIIPMTVSFFLKRSEKKTKGRRDAILYGIAIIVIYVTLGILIT